MNSFYLHFCHRLSLWWFLAKVSFISCVCTCDQPETAHLCIMDGLFQNTETKQRSRPRHKMGEVWKPGQPWPASGFLCSPFRGWEDRIRWCFISFQGDICSITIQIIFIEGRSQKTVLFGKVFPSMGGWGVWFPNKVQTPQNHRETTHFWPEFHLLCSQISHKPWGGFTDLGNFPK